LAAARPGVAATKASVGKHAQRKVKELSGSTSSVAKPILKDVEKAKNPVGCKTYVSHDLLCCVQFISLLF